jgi:hypothetical protein
MRGRRWLVAAGVPARLRGSIAVNRLAVADGRQDVLTVRRIEATALDVHWPSRVVVDRVVVSGPRTTVERDRAGAFPARDLLGPPTPSPTARTAAMPASSGSTPLAIDVGAIVVRDGAMLWRDEAVSPPARLEVSSISGNVTGIGWPLRGPADVNVALRPPGGGHARLSGRVGLDPVTADVRVVTTKADLAPYQRYAPTTGRIAGLADLDLAVVVPSLDAGRVTARGRAAVARVEVRDGQRTVARVERAEATGVDVQWPERIAVGRLALTQPWIVLERDEQGALPSRRLLGAPATTSAAPGDPTEPRGRDEAPPAPVISVTQLTMDNGAIRIVDRAVAPAFAVDFQPATLRAQGLATVSDRPARVDLQGRLGPGAELTLRGTIGPLAGPLLLDLAGEVREFAVPRANPYVLQQAGWKTTEGRLTSRFQARVDGDALAAKTDIRVSRLRLVRAMPEDGAQTRIGLPLNMLGALMKDRNGDITLSFPVGGRLDDPRFDFSEAIWSAVRTVAINAITLPVSWIGRVRFTPDSRIERIDVDPVTFAPGAPTPTEDGQRQATRLAAFLEELPEIRMALTPAISTQDVSELKRRALDAAVERVAGEGRRSREAAVKRLFEQAFPGQRAPESLEAMLGTLLERQPLQSSATTQLAEQRVEAVRTTVKAAGVDPARLVAMQMAEREPGARVELNVVAPETERPSRLKEALRRLGVPVGKE